MLLVFVLIMVFEVKCQTISTRIVGGKPTSIENYPIMAQLLIDPWKNQQYSLYCAGVIITARHVLTVAHCFHHSAYNNNMDPKLWKIRAGSTLRTKGGTLHDVKNIVCHPSFIKSQYINDIAVVISGTRFELGNNLRQGAIPTKGYTVADGSTCTIVGWGANITNGIQPNQLQYGYVKIISRTTCYDRYQNIPDTSISQSMICAGLLDKGDVDGCSGDSGGPLICDGLVYGLISFGYTCGSPVYPGVYTNVAEFSDWIVSTVSSSN